MAAVLACGEGAVLSHTSAAAHWELLGSAAAKIDVTARVTRVGLPGIRLHRSRSLDARDTTSHEGVPITTVPRTLLDLADDHRAITDLLARANGHQGTGTLARATSREDP
jgi:hypothetical protein